MTYKHGPRTTSAPVGPATLILDEVGQAPPRDIGFPPVTNPSFGCVPVSKTALTSLANKHGWQTSLIDLTNRGFPDTSAEELEFLLDLGSNAITLEAVALGYELKDACS